MGEAKFSQKKMSTTKKTTTTKKTSNRSRRPSRAKAKARTTATDLVSVNSNYARVALMLIAVNVAFTGYVLYKLITLST